MKLLLLVLALMSTFSCAQVSNTDSQTCRVYPKTITDTTNSINYSCTYNGSTTLSCTNGGSETITYTYANLQSFVNEAAAPVSVFNKYAFTSLVFGSATAARQFNFSLTYNASGQHSALTVVWGGGQTSASTYSSWDSNKRPIAGTQAITAGGTCTGRILNIVYTDGSTRNRVTNATGGTGANCTGLGEGTNVSDANGNMIFAAENNYTTNSTATQCY